MVNGFQGASHKQCHPSCVYGNLQNSLYIRNQHIPGTLNCRTDWLSRNADLKNYKLPRIGDVGELVAIMHQPASEYDRGVVGLGEPPVIAPGAAISNAVANATGIRVPVIPLTPKRVLDALKKGGNA